MVVNGERDGLVRLDASPLIFDSEATRHVRRSSGAPLLVAEAAVCPTSRVANHIVHWRVRRFHAAAKEAPSHAVGLFKELGIRLERNILSEQNTNEYQE